MALDVFNSVLVGLCSGNICIADLKLLMDQEQSFIDIFNIIETNFPTKPTTVPNSDIPSICKSEVVIKILQWRKRELTQFATTCALVNNLIEMSSDCQSS